ncbi:AarF/UbiB family protein [Candidatus Comchoanobacter bicostacola]|uniref:AarF/UbiB family protein n=1 Tax=Candidatus Comchoanobacter bicostacola TaxID=2919598 RepID=A0ABY5DMG3_9GAMM|nr:AarF/UbiB family protein [Candidatus Comchoanobacter bicostacola]UTC24837.1 AarF/UbiB family protein [Candidatus Comchoanobacter bicostacola]
MIQNITRTLRILSILYTYEIDQLIFPKILRLSYFTHWLVPKEIKTMTRDVRCFHACIQLGPLFVKLGQLVSIRQDLFPDDITNTLTQLQDKTPPADFQAIQTQIESALNKSIDQVFSQINPIPIGSASIAQAHAAQLNNGKSVVIKVLKPNIKKEIKRDLKLLNFLCRFIKHKAIAKTLLHEYELTLMHELNLYQEASHYSQMRHNFSQDERIYIPYVYWQYSATNIIVLEHIKASKLADVLSNPEVCKKELAYTGIQLLFEQVFEHRFFHADMHPGNLFFDTTNPNKPKYILIDFGIIGILSPNDQYYLAECFLAFYHRDYTRIAQLHVDAQWVSPNANIIQLEHALRGVCEPLLTLPLQEISIAHLMHEIITTCKKFDLNIQPQLLMLQKTLFHTESISRKLYPELNIWQAAAPYIKSFMKKRVSIQSGWHHMKHELPRIFSQSPEIPRLLHAHLKQKPPATTKTRSSSLFILGVTVGCTLSLTTQLTIPIGAYIITHTIIIMILLRQWKV